MYIFKYFDEGLSQQNARDDSQGHASTKKKYYFHLHLRGDSQHENISINKPSYRGFEIFVAKYLSFKG